MSTGKCVAKEQLDCRSKNNTYSFGHPGQIGFRSAGHKPTSCPDCAEHLLHRAHPQICWVVKGFNCTHFD